MSGSEVVEPSGTPLGTFQLVAGFRCFQTSSEDIALAAELGQPGVGLGQLQIDFFELTLLLGVLRFECGQVLFTLLLPGLCGFCLGGVDRLRQQC